MILTLKWPQGINKTFSQHAAAQNATIFYYIVLFLLALPILYLFFYKYFVPHYQLSNVVLYLVASSTLAQIACTFVPETGGVKTLIHQLFARVSGALLIAVIVCSIVASTISSFDKIIMGACLAIMLLILGLVIVWKRSPLPQLLLQAAYYGVFFGAIIFATF
ncbi:hypothetical protein IPL85_05880 [Candidatus Saccharibacteria bacterium]|nr:MAG: hypothetical protein IPL85_05880 [Candidatus Saccharibacteria bacterium]